jgi:hypothetical protein
MRRLLMEVGSKSRLTGRNSCVVAPLLGRVCRPKFRANDHDVARHDGRDGRLLLRRLRRENDVFVLSTFSELQFAIDRRKPIVPLKLYDGEWPPQPGGAGSHQNMFAFTSDIVYLEPDRTDPAACADMILKQMIRIFPGRVRPRSGYPALAQANSGHGAANRAAASPPRTTVGAMVSAPALPDNSGSARMCSMVGSLLHTQWRCERAGSFGGKMVARWKLVDSADIHIYMPEYSSADLALQDDPYAPSTHTSLESPRNGGINGYFTFEHGLLQGEPSIIRSKWGYWHRKGSFITPDTHII